MVEVRTADQLKDLKELLTSGGDVSIAVAYVRKSGLNLIKQEMNAALDSLKEGESFRFLLYLDGIVTDPDGIDMLMDFSEKYAGKIFLKYFCIPHATFHPKLYIRKGNGSVTFLSGSYNLTRSALDMSYKSKNIEHGIRVTCPDSAKIAKQVTKEFTSLWKDKRAKPLDNMVAGRYRRAYAGFHRNNGQNLENAGTCELSGTLGLPLPKYWIFKCNPNREGPTKGFNFEKLYNKNGPVSWGEVGQNDNTRKHIKQDIRKGHRVLFYHSSSKPSAVMGTAQVVQEFYSDPEYSPEPLVNIQAYQRFANPVTLDQIKQNTKLQDLYCKRLLTDVTHRLRKVID